MYQAEPSHALRGTLLFSSLLAVAATTCAPPPIPVRIGNVTLSTDEVARGLDISIGSPKQSFAFMPQWPLNNTFVFGTNGFCSSTWTTAACTTFRGGLYDALGSATRDVASTTAYPVDTSPYPSMSYVSENLTLSSNVTLGEFPIGIAQASYGEQGYFPQVALGLGSNSTVLGTLKRAGHIASRSWGMFWGRTGAATGTQLDGNFVFGGYDRAKVTGPNYTSPLTTAKPTCTTEMLVTITDMVLNFPNGTDQSLFGSSQSSTVLAACIVPTYPVLMTIPTSPYFNNFESFTGENLPGRTFGIYYYGMLYDTSSGAIPYGGDLTFQFDSGLKIRIPNDQLVVPNLTIDETSGALIANSSAPELVLNAIQQVNAGDLPQLGRQFLTAAYLMVNQDTNSFTLWQANPTSKVDLVALDSSNNVVESFCAADSGTGATTTSGTIAASGSAQTRSAKLNDKDDAKLGTGAIAGIAIGGIAVAGAFVGFLIWFLARRRKSNGASSSSDPHSSFMQTQEPPPIKSPTFIPQNLYRSELQGSGSNIPYKTEDSKYTYSAQDYQNSQPGIHEMAS